MNQKAFSLFILLSVLFGLACSLDKFLSKSNLTADSNDGTCLQRERLGRCRSQTPVLSCLQYRNGTQRTGLVDRCEACSDRNVFAVKQDCCEEDRGTHPPIEGICQRAGYCFIRESVPSCVCYTNGTCVNRNVDACSACRNLNVYSVVSGTCKTLTLPNSEDICPRGRTVCYQGTPALSCVCFFNGTCESQIVDKCTSCTTRNVSSVSAGCCGSEAFSESTDCRKDELKKCDKRGGKNIFCPPDFSQGCVCYQNGTCIEGPVNPCLQCQQDDVVSAEIGSKCPCRAVTGDDGYNDDDGSQCINRKINSCRNYAANAACSSNKWPGCVCYDDGTCEERNLNPCDECLNTQGVIAAQINTKCPCPGIQI